MTIFALDVFQWPRSQNGKWEMNGTPVQGGQEGTVHPPTDCVDLYVDVVCHVECAIARGRHIQLLTVATNHIPVAQCVASHHMHIQIDVVGV